MKQQQQISPRRGVGMARLQLQLLVELVGVHIHSQVVRRSLPIRLRYPWEQIL